MAKLRAEEVERYNRQMMIDGWGDIGQEKLKNATVFLAGAGGLGSPVAIYLAVAGVGKIRVVDFDKLESSNLNRQVLHSVDRVGMKKAESAKKTLNAMNPWVEIEAIEDKIDESNVERLVGDADIIVDCMDNFPTRFLLNDVAIKKAIPMVHASVWGLEGRITFIQSPETPCLRCLFSDSPPKELFPVLGATPGVIGVMQAMEALKYLAGVGKLLKGRLFLWDGTDMTTSTIKLRKDPECISCSKK